MVVEKGVELTVNVEKPVVGIVGDGQTTVKIQRGMAVRGLLASLPDEAQIIIAVGCGIGILPLLY